MPNITEFEAGELAIRPSETGVEAHAMAGRRIGVSYNETAAAYSKVGAELGRGIANTGEAAVNYADHQQINAGADKFSQMFATAQDSLNKTLTDPNFDVHDPTSMQRWRTDKLEPMLDQFQNSGFFTTEKSQQWASQRVNEMRQHFYVESEGAASHISGVAAEARINNSVRNYSNGVVANPSPGAVDFAVKSYKDHLEDTIAQFPNLKGEEAAKLREDVAEKGAQQIVHDGVMAAIMKGGDWRGIANKYPDYVNGAEMLQFEKAQKVQDRARASYDAQTKFYNTQVANAKVAQDSKQIFQNNVAKDAQGNPQINPQFFKDILSLPVNNPSASTVSDVARTYLQWGEKAQTGFANETDAKTDENIKARLFDAQNPTSELDIRKAEADGKMTVQNGAVLSSLIAARDAAPIKDPTFNAAMQSVRRQTGNANFTGFLYSFLPQYQKGIADGTLPPNALDLNDPKSLISQSLKAYKPSLGAAISANGGVGASM